MENNKIYSYKKISSFIMYVYNSSADKLWTDENYINGFKFDVLSDYINFMDDMHNMDRSYMSSVTEFREQYRFMDKLYELAGRYMFEGPASLEGKEETILRMIVEHIFKWIEQDGYINFKKVEKQYYTTKAFSKEDNPTQQLAGRFAQLKNMEEQKNKLG